MIGALAPIIPGSAGGAKSGIQANLGITVAPKTSWIPLSRG